MDPAPKIDQIKMQLIFVSVVAVCKCNNWSEIGILGTLKIFDQLRTENIFEQLNFDQMLFDQMSMRLPQSRAKRIKLWKYVLNSQRCARVKKPGRREWDVFP